VTSAAPPPADLPPGVGSLPPGRLRGAIRARVLARPSRPEAQAAAAALAGLAGDSLAGVVFFGSRRTRAGPDAWSAYDFFVVTRSYRRFYRAVRGHGLVRRSPLVLAALSRILPPTQVSLRLPAGEGTTLHAKCAVISLAAFERELSDRRRDHFCIGRLFQPSEVLFASDEGVREALVTALANAYASTYAWARPWLPPSFDAAAYGLTLLRVSLGREIRPEPPGRAEALWTAQRAEQEPLFGLLLEDLAARGELRRPAAGSEAEYSLARPVRGPEKLRTDVYFRWSLVRATARWTKHIVTFEGWLDYIVKKAKRRAGEEIVLTPRERRFPLLFLWPRLFRYLREKGKREAR
jgi:hypothetical protein